MIEGTSSWIWVGNSGICNGTLPGIPSELAKPYVIEETGDKADLLT